jgi:hypothetical protein
MLPGLPNPELEDPDRRRIRSGVELVTSSTGTIPSEHTYVVPRARVMLQHSTLAGLMSQEHPVFA